MRLRKGPLNQLWMDPLPSSLIPSSIGLGALSWATCLSGQVGQEDKPTAVANGSPPDSWDGGGGVLWGW